MFPAGSRFASPARTTFAPLGNQFDSARGKPGKNAHRRKTEFLRDTAANKTSFLGVTYRPGDDRYVARIRDHKTRGGAKVYCGSARTAEEAARAYDRKARELYGVRAVLNFPEGA